jgi:hypothetical protein
VRGALLLGALAALALGACGAEPPAEAERPQPTETAVAATGGDRIPRSARRATERWVGAANAICRRAHEELAALAPDLERVDAARAADAPGWAQQAAVTYGKVDKLMTGAFEQLQELSKSRKDPRPGQVLAAFGQLIHHLELAAGYHGDGAIKLGTEFLHASWRWAYVVQKRGRAIGVTECFPGQPVGG